MSAETTAQDDRREQLRFVARVYRLRVLGLGAGAIAVGAAFAVVGASMPAWIAMLAHGVLWPHVAAAFARRRASPQTWEFRNLILDSALGGFWLACMHFMLLPSALLMTMLSMDKLAVGGWRFLARTASAQLLGALVGAGINGFAFELPAPISVVIACMPLLIAYPLAVSTATYALVGKVRRQNHQLAQLSRVDPLTGLLNRAAWEMEAARELARAHRNSVPATLLMIDVDHFKHVNDLYGHPVGDSALRGIAAAIADCVRSIDIPGRYGGDEFAVVLSGTRLAEAMQIAERIRERIATERFDPALPGPCTISVGAAELDDSLSDTRDWLIRADAALYRAKTLGRNRSEAARAA